MGGWPKRGYFLDFRGMDFDFFGFRFVVFFRCRDVRPAAQSLYFYQKNKVTKQKLTLLPPTLRCAKGNLHHASHAVRCETPDALKRSGQTVATSQFTKLLRHLTQQPPRDWRDAGVGRREWRG